MSSTESELNSLADANQENEWITNLIRELWQVEMTPTLFHINNSGLLDKIKDFGSHSKTKHLDIKAKYLREKFKKGEIKIKLVPSQSMIANSLTKACLQNSLDSLLNVCFGHSSQTEGGVE